MGTRASGPDMRNFLLRIPYQVAFSGKVTTDLTFAIVKPFDEATVLKAAHAYEQATDWHRRKPSL
ncbi:MAG: hypothetical protein HY278_03630 [candidate division NC10 bacterium]|nr:hypothetical protein [candidate division NC10 bacterium]